MLLARRMQNPSTWIATGCSLLGAGILIQRFGPLGEGAWGGFLAGLSGAFIGASIFFNIRGLTLRRRRGA